eukprot:gene30347-36668_t
MSELDRFRDKIEATEAKLKKAEEDGRTEAYLISIQNTLAKQWETLNLLLAQSVPVPGGVVTAATGWNSTSIDGILSPVNIKSPTNSCSDHLIKKGFALFIRKPLSLDTSAVACHPMLVNVDDLPFCPSLGHNEHVGILPLDETEYYDHFSRFSLSGILESTLRPGKKKSAGKLFPGAFDKKCCVTLPSQCQPELATRVKAPARAASGGEMKPIDEVAMEEQFMYTTIAMSDSYFSSEVYPEHQAFYKSPPIGCSILGAGPMGMLFAAEWIGIVFFSIVSQPFYAGSSNHKAALHMFDMIESTRDASDPLLIPRNFLLKSNPQQKLGVAWGVMDGYFIKIVEAPFLLVKQNVDLAGFNKGDNKYRAIVGEEACGEASWVSNSTFFYHLYKVMTVWRAVWEAECVGDDARHRDVFVPVDMLFGEFSVCLRSPFVGTTDADNGVFADKDLMLPVVGAVLWLARTWQLLYIDLRPPNLRLLSEEEGGSSRIRLVDYDDMVILKDKPCCDYSTVCTMYKNEHMKKVFRQYKKLAELFDNAGTTNVCCACALENAKETLKLLLAQSVPVPDAVDVDSAMQPMLWENAALSCFLEVARASAAAAAREKGSLRLTRLLPYSENPHDVYAI